MTERERCLRDDLRRAGWGLADIQAIVYGAKERRFVASVAAMQAIYARCPSVPEDIAQVPKHAVGMADMLLAELGEAP